MLKFSVTQLRVLFILVNLTLTGAVGAHAVYRVMNPYSDPDPRLTKWMKYKPEVFKTKRIQSGPSATGEIRKVQGVGQILDPPPVPPKPVGGETEEPEETPEVADETLVEGGPLQDKWEFVNAIVFGADSPLNQAILKQASPSARRTAGSRVRYRPSSSSSSSRSPARRTSSAASRSRTRSSSQNMRVLKLFGGLKIEDADESETITVVGIEEDRLLYVVDSEIDDSKAESIATLDDLHRLVRASKRYYLTREVQSPFKRGEDGWFMPPSEDEEEKGQEDHPKQPKPVDLIGTLSTGESAFVRRLEDPESTEGTVAAPSSSSSRTSGSKTSSSRAPTRRPPTKEEKAKLESTLRKAEAKMTPKQKAAMKAATGNLPKK